ncbi:hypothetical protein CF65_01338 [Aggregatibacter actinomycetemcomitans HK1651]|nr:hypothetical protein CF65_01338 [Aggregatibacter actinomycetemcomitans HK1651]
MRKCGKKSPHFFYFQLAKQEKINKMNERSFSAMY